MKYGTYVSKGNDIRHAFESQKDLNLLRWIMQRLVNNLRSRKQQLSTYLFSSNWSAKNSVRPYLQLALKGSVSAKC